MARILVVDDEPDVRELFNITLKMAGHETRTAKDGMEAVDYLKEESSPPDLILLDLMMPRLDGFGFLKHIRDERESDPFRVLVATAKILEPEDQRRLNAWPVVGTLNKGDLDIGQMVNIVKNALDASPENKAAKSEDKEDKKTSEDKTTTSEKDEEKPGEKESTKENGK